jgi:hypothetical protein
VSDLRIPQGRNGEICAIALRNLAAAVREMREAVYNDFASSVEFGELHAPYDSWAFPTCEMTPCNRSRRNPHLP